jgi:hypothetical protein
MRITGATALGVGIGSLAAGVAFLVIDGNPYESDCSGSNVDEFGNCRQRYNTLIHGAVLTAVGGAAVAAGIGLLVAGRKRGGEKSSGTQARIGITPGGVVVQGKF